MTLLDERITLSKPRIRQFCKRYHIRKLAFFGSVLRSDFRSDSDIDVLVEFDTDHVPGLDFFTIEAELSKLLGAKVDLNTPGFLEPEIRRQVLDESIIQYEQA